MSLHVGVCVLAFNTVYLRMFVCVCVSLCVCSVCVCACLSLNRSSHVSTFYFRGYAAFLAAGPICWPAARG